MFQKSYKILSTEKLNNTTFSFVISCPELAEESWCGRFVNVLCGEKTLRRPISISEIDKQKRLKAQKNAKKLSFGLSFLVILY